VELDSCPNFLSKGKSIFRMRFTDENELEWPIPYELKVCMATFEVRKQTTEKMVELPVIWLTSDEPWNPYSLNWEQYKNWYLQEMKMKNQIVPQEQVK